MKPYGHSRTDKFMCDWGCCTFKSGVKLKCRKVNDKVNRKTARREAKKVEYYEDEVQDHQPL